MRHFKIKEAFYEMHFTESLFKEELYFPMHYRTRGGKMKKRFVPIIIIAALAILSITAWKADSTIKGYAKSIKVGKESRTINVVEIDLNAQNISMEVVTPKDKLGGSEKFTDMIKRKKPMVAINANFFNSYTNLEPLGTIVKDGRILFLGNTGTTVGITKDNKLVFGNPKTSILGALDGKYKNEYIKGQMVWNAWTAWYLNDLGVNDYSVAVYTPDRGEKVNLRPGMAVIVKNNIVSQVVETPKEVSIPMDGYVIYYGPKADKDYKAYVNNRFKVGRPIEYKLFIKNSEGGFQWENMNYAISAGPRLITNGTIKIDCKSEGFRDPRITTNRNQRSALGVTKDNRMILVTVPNVNVNELAVIMKSFGCVDAMNLDGGASSALYYNGKVLTTPGRNLSTVLMIYKK